MKYIESFMLGEIGIDILNSDATDVKEISRYIESHYINFIDRYQQTSEGRLINTLYDYYKYLLDDDTKNPWQVLMYEEGLKCFNGYRGMTAETYMLKNMSMTANEMLEKNRKEITEKEIEGLLCLE